MPDEAPTAGGRAHRRGALEEFLRRWLDAKLDRRVSVKASVLNGWADLVRSAPAKAKHYLANPDVIAVVGIVDLQGPNYPGHLTTVTEKAAWLRNKVMGEVAQEKFRLHFAVHELEAWLIAQPDILPKAVASALPKQAVHDPESINFNEPPGSLLARLYREKLKKNYSKPTDGKKLFAALDPEVAASKCRRLRELLTDLESLAQAALRKPAP